MKFFSGMINRNGITPKWQWIFHRIWITSARLLVLISLNNVISLCLLSQWGSRTNTINIASGDALQYHSTWPYASNVLTTQFDMFALFLVFGCKWYEYDPTTISTQPASYISLTHTVWVKVSFRGPDLYKEIHGIDWKESYLPRIFRTSSRNDFITFTLRFDANFPTQIWLITLERSTRTLCSDRWCHDHNDNLQIHLWRQIWHHGNLGSQWISFSGSRSLIVSNMKIRSLSVPGCPRHKRTRHLSHQGDWLSQHWDKGMDK